jgi:MFS family permease
MKTRRYAWYVVGLLLATQIVSYIDRFLPSLLIQWIKEDLQLTDFQVGLLMGPAFGLFYVFVGVPIGWLADRYSRRTILSIGITIWCAMTAMAGFVKSFVPLFGARMGVGLGEAAVAPCAVSLISDYFPGAVDRHLASAAHSGRWRPRCMADELPVRRPARFHPRGSHVHDS